MKTTLKCSTVGRFYTNFIGLSACLSDCLKTSGTLKTIITSKDEIDTPKATRFCIIWITRHKREYEILQNFYRICS